MYVGVSDDVPIPIPNLAREMYTGAFYKKNFYILDAQRHYKENSFDFVLKSVGFYEYEYHREIPKIQN